MYFVKDPESITAFNVETEFGAIVERFTIIGFPVGTLIAAMVYYTDPDISDYTNLILNWFVLLTILIILGMVFIDGFTIFTLTVGLSCWSAILARLYLSGVKKIRELVQKNTLKQE